ncbi:unnamed protein product, partial [Strongylus vulgaris]
MAVFVKGRKVVDLWGGYADIQAARTWKKASLQDTISIVFSTTKAVAAVCIALLADRGRLKYDDLVSKYWPGFAKNGKENITIDIVFSTTKAVAAVCIALLADRGRLNYDDLVSKYWPGFAKNGKENITIEWVMSHMSGLHYFDTPIT